MLNIVAAVNLGTKDEVEETNGLVHLLEHYILFRGTQERSSNQVCEDIRRHGAYFNAHTGQDLALFEISLPSEYADFGLNNQKEILFNLKLSQTVLDEEKEVILEEISQIEDDPLKYAMSLVYQNLFKGHPYQRSIYGKRENIQALTVEQLEAYYKKYFIPGNCALAVVGDFALNEIEKKVRDIYGKIKKETLVPSRLEKAAPLEDPIEIEKELDVQKAYLIIATQGPDYNHPDQYALDLLIEILGRGINPLLNSALRRRVDLIQTVSTDFLSHKYGGVLLIYFTLDPKDLNAAKREAIDFLKKARSENYSRDDFLSEEQFYAYDYLQGAKNQIKFAASRAQENGLSVARSLVMFMLLNENQERGNYIENIQKVSSSDLRKAASKYFSRKGYVTVSISPKKSKVR